MKVKALEDAGKTEGNKLVMFSSWLVVHVV